MILLTSSLFVAHAAQAARAGKFTDASRLIGLGVACGVGFVVLKMFEWLPKISAGITPGSNDFFMYYYMLTGLHLFHVLLGLVILLILRKALQGASRPRAEIVETGATYWHMVDVLWIILFALIYLMR